MDILSLDAGEYLALAQYLDQRANEIEHTLPPVVSAVNGSIFEGKFATRAKAQLMQCRHEEDNAADAVRGAAKVARQRAADLEQAQVVELARRAAVAAREIAERARRLLGAD